MMEASFKMSQMFNRSGIFRNDSRVRKKREQFTRFGSVIVYLYLSKGHVSSIFAVISCFKPHYICRLHRCNDPVRPCLCEVCYDPQLTSCEGFGQHSSQDSAVSMF